MKKSLAEISQNLERLAAKAPEQLEANYVHETVDPLQRQLRLIHELMGDDSIYAKASLLHPETRMTEVLRHLLEVFRPSGKRSVLLLGGVGNGKTFGVIAYTVDQMHRYGFTHSAAFITAYDLAYLIQSKKFDELDKLSRRKILVIDDLGTEPAGWKGNDFLSHFENLFNERHRMMRHTYITSNLTWEKFREVYGARLASRLRESGQVYEVTEADMRVSS